jgi:hypothetical protein
MLSCMCTWTGTGSVLVHAPWKRGCSPCCAGECPGPLSCLLCAQSGKSHAFALATVPSACSGARSFGTPQDVCRALGMSVCQQDAELSMTPAGDLQAARRCTYADEAQQQDRCKAGVCIGAWGLQQITAEGQHGGQAILHPTLHYQVCAAPGSCQAICPHIEFHDAQALLYICIQVMLTSTAALCAGPDQSIVQTLDCPSDSEFSCLAQDTLHI